MFFLIVRFIDFRFKISCFFSEDVLEGWDNACTIITFLAECCGKGRGWLLQQHFTVSFTEVPSDRGDVPTHKAIRWSCHWRERFCCEFHEILREIFRTLIDKDYYCIIFIIPWIQGWYLLKVKVKKDKKNFPRGKWAWLKRSFHTDAGLTQFRETKLQNSELGNRWTWPDVFAVPL